MTDLERKIHQIRNQQLAILNFATNTRKTAKAKQTKGFLEARKLLLYTYWEKYVLLHEQILASTTAADESTLKSFVDKNESESIEISYAETLGELNDLLESITKSVQNLESVHTASGIVQQSTQSLPRIKIPSFDGNFLNWCSFKDLFTSIVINNSNLTNTQRLQYLKDSLIESAKHALDNISTTDTNFKISWELLLQKYENKRIIIHAQLTQIVNIPKAQDESAASLRIICDGATAAVRALKQLGRPVEHWDDWLTFTLVYKLDPATRKAWELSLSTPDEIPTFSSLRAFLESRVQSLEVLQSFASSKRSPKDNGPAGKVLRPQAIKGYHTTTESCPLCSENHILLFCNDFKGKPHQDKYDVVVKANFCFNCMRKGHQARSCPSKYNCQKCKKRHHTQLHEHFENSKNSGNISNSEQPPVTANNTYVHEQLSPRTTTSIQPVLIGTALAEVHSDTGHTLTLRMLLDTGSEATFISGFAAKQLKLKRTAVNVPISGANGEKVTCAQGLTTFTLKSLRSSFEMSCSALVLPQVGSLSPSNQIPHEEVQEFLELSLADPHLDVPRSIDVILSAADYAAVFKPELKRSSTNNMIAQNTQLGWVIFGGLSKQRQIMAKGSNCYHTRIELDQELRRFWELEEVNTLQPWTKAELFCEEFFEQTTQRAEDGRYIVRLPIKSETNLHALMSSKNDALLMLGYMNRRLARDPALHQLYNDFLDEYHTLGHMEPIEDTDNAEVTCYLPHHGVRKDDSTTTKLRVVFNASKKYKEGVSLNDCLHVGPKLQTDLAALVLRWRCYKVAFTGGIAKMYRQIWVNKKDVDLQRILWRPSDAAEPKSYRLLTVTYGTNCAPYLEIKVLHTLANDEQQSFPEASKTLLNEFYVDDALSGANTASEAVGKITELQKLLKTGGFELRKFNSNSSEVLDNIGGDREHSVSLSLDLRNTAKTLGIVWITKTDQLTYNLNLDFSIKQFTKRQLLSDIAKLFDPIGLLAPIIVKGKIFLQRLWQTGLDWNDYLAADLQQDWMRFRADLQDIDKLRIPRWVGTSSHQTYEYHVFADASQHAYAAAIYLKVSTGDSTKIYLVTAKSKVAPLKKITIPRLELCAAHLAAKLLQKVHSALPLKVKRSILWSDSTTALYWIRSDPGKLKEFVANRVAQIQHDTTTYDWRYVPTNDNPADLASRGISAQELIDSTIWWNGPQWLHHTEKSWPKLSIQPNDHIPEIKTIKVATAQLQVTDNFAFIEKYSNLDTLLTVIARVLRFIKACRRLPVPTGKICSWDERQDALKRLIAYVQHSCFNNEYRTLLTSQTIDQRSKLKKLNPVLDSAGLIRLSGRLHNANIPVSERYPLILPKENSLTTLLINWAHKSTLHGGVQATLHHLRRKYWIVDGRTAVKRVLRRCLTCFKHSCAPTTQLMGDLPPERCNISLPFLHTGVDYAGPFSIRTTKGRGYRSYKGYVALFICLATRAIHLELVSDMTTDAFLAAFKRFSSTRGRPTTMYSDRGTTFVGADSLLQQEHQQFVQQLTAASSYCSLNGTNWHFIPPAAPNFGGLWEAGVKSMKYHLKRVINATTLTFEEFYTLLKQVEGCLNSRPLSAMTDDPSDLTALTPAHFLTGRSILSIPEPDVLSAKIGLLSRWKQLTQMTQDFWRRWSNEYLPQLQSRNKWRSCSTQVKVGQLVLIRDERAPPTQWMLGRITATHPGADDLVRVVTIKTSTTTLKRPISKIAVLPIEDNFTTEDGGRRPRNSTTSQPPSIVQD